MKLSPSQISNLISLHREWITSLQFPSTELAKTELAFTSSFLLPRLREQVAGMQKPELYVRGDGGPAVQPLVTERMTFYPDLAVVSSLDRYLAFEVKILRDSDPGGALTKAIGQTVMYSTLGYAHSFGLIFDARGSQDRVGDLSYDRIFLSSGNSEVHLFK